MNTYVSRVRVGRDLGIALVVCTLFWSPRADALPLGTAYVDSQSGLEWAELDGTTHLTWEQVAGVCGTDGVGVCSSNLGSVELSGWTWATSAQVLTLFVNASDLTPEQSSDQDEATTNSTWAAQLLSLFGTTFTQDGDVGLQAFSADGPSFDPQGAWVPYVVDGGTGSMDIASRRRVVAKYLASDSIGLWLNRPTSLSSSSTTSSVPEPTTLSLTGLGIAGLIVRRVRRRSVS
jgi:hypothetical protein